MAGVLVKGLVSYDYNKAVRGSSFIRLYDANGFCFKQFSDISEAGFADYANYQVTSDNSAVSGKTYYKRSGDTFKATSFSKGVYELIPFEKYEVAYTAGAGTVAATVNGSIADKKLTLSLPTGMYVQNKLQINFKTPVASCDLTHIVIDGENYELVDSENVCTCNYKHAFEVNSIVSVIIDMEDKKASVQNLKFNSRIEVSKVRPTDEIDVWFNPDGTGFSIDNEVTFGSDNLVTSNAVYQFVMNLLDERLKNT